MHGFQNNFAQVFSLKSRSAILNICSCTYTYSSPSLYPPPPPPPPSPPAKKKIVRLGFFCQFIEKYPPLKKWNHLCPKKSLTNPPNSPRPHTPPPNPAHFFFLIWIICRLEFFYKLTKNPNIKKNLFFRGGRAVVAGRGSCVNIMFKCLKWQFYSSRNTNVLNYSEIHA